MRSMGEIMYWVNDGMTQEEANDVLKLHVEECVVLGDDKEEATKLFRTNIGYFAQYYDRWTRDRAYELFETEHPIWGKECPTPEEIALEFKHGRRTKES